MTDTLSTTADVYAKFAAREARGVSPAYERLALAVSRNREMLTLLDTLPLAKRQPNLLFGAVRLLGGPVEDPAAFCEYSVANWRAVAAEMRTRTTQTNEAGRCAVLLPVLAALPQPLALLEVGARPPGCASTPTGTATATATTSSAQGHPSWTARRPVWRPRTGYRTWCGGRAWT